MTFTFGIPERNKSTRKERRNLFYPKICSQKQKNNTLNTEKSQHISTLGKNNLTMRDKTISQVASALSNFHVFKTLLSIEQNKNDNSLCLMDN